MSDTPNAAKVATLRASWLASLQAGPRLPERTVIVRNEATAHAWRRDLVQAGRSDLLLGTRFVTPVAAASAILDANDVVFTLGEESVRPARIAALFKEGLALHAFDLDVLRTRPGWDRAFASTIGDLEAALQTPATLLASSDVRCHDIAELWTRLDASAGSSWTAARALLESASLLNEASSRWPFSGPCLVEVTGHETAALAAWLRAIPAGIQFAHLDLRPRRTVHEERKRLLFGDLSSQSPTIAGTSERDLLARFLFAPPDEIADRARPRSSGIDNTVHFEEHAGIEDELDAAVSWVIGEVAEHGTPLEQLAIVVPRLDPYAALLAHRFKALGEENIYVVGGLPVKSGGGARVAAILRALASYLHIDTMAEVLPILELSNKELHISRRDAIALLYDMGTTGGSAAHRSGALDWAARRVHREAAITAELAATATDGDAARKVWALERNLERFVALQPSLGALDGVARRLVAQASLEDLWGTLQQLFATHVRLGGDGKRVIAAIDASIAPLVRANVLSGDAALEAIVGTLDAMRLPSGRFGEPRVTIVALADAVGLSFRAARVLGLSEGSVPSNAREDPVLPDAARSSLGRSVRISTDRTLAQLHALLHVVLTTSERLVLSTSRMDPEGVYREPSGILIEAAAAVSRAPIGSNDVFIPDAQLMRQTAWEPARAYLRDVRERWPVDQAALLRRASRDGVVPDAWPNATLIPLERSPASAVPGVSDGWFPDGAFPDLPGLSSERPISASALGQLLECPHRFLYERVLGWRPPPELAEEGNIDALSYGSLFHETAELFYRSHGATFCAKSHPLDHWHTIASEVADRCFQLFLESYPLVGEDVRTAQRDRLRRDLRSLLEADWSVAKTFVDVERSFGPTPLQLGGETVHVHGFIDRIDTVGAATLVRDLKTGRSKPRDKREDLRPPYDVQLGLYGLVARAKAEEWGVPETIQGAYVYPADPTGDDRNFQEDFDDLAAATDQWIGMAMRLLQKRRFPRTPVERDCQFCSFKPVCGARAQVRAEEMLHADVDMHEFATLKLGDGEDDE